jgi:hypothetical protein
VPVPPDQQVLQNRRMLEKLDVLECARDAKLGDAMRREAGQLAVLIQDPPARRRIQEPDQVEDRRLSGAVRPDDREHLATLHLERHIVDRDDAAELDAEVLDLEKAHRSRSDFMYDFCRRNMPLR